MALWLVTAPVNPVILLEEAKDQIRRGDVEDDDAFLTNVVIPAATQRAEHETHRQLVEATYDLKLDAFPCVIEVPRPPLIAVTSVSYVDTDGVTQVLATSEYQISAPSGPRCRRARIRPAYGKSWPSTRAQMDAVTVRFTAGYGTNGVDVPALLRQGILLDIGSLYEHRESVIVGQSGAIELPWSSRMIYRSFKSFATV